MAKYISRRNPVSVGSLKRKPCGSVVLRHYGRVDTQFTRVTGGWLRDTDSAVVSSATVARECNGAVGCRESWAKVY